LVTGTVSNDNLNSSTQDAAVLHVIVGDDIISGADNKIADSSLHGNNLIYEGSADDTINAGNGRDIVFDGTGTSRELINSGGDIFNGTSNNELIYTNGSNGDVSLREGNGQDIFTFENDDFYSLTPDGKVLTMRVRDFELGDVDAPVEDEADILNFSGFFHRRECRSY
jgi:Ca2+-binding RTX toxin-like protein